MHPSMMSQENVAQLEVLPFFVYGTLKVGEGNHQLVARNVTSIQEARVHRARIFDGGAFPYTYIELSYADQDVVYGELIWVLPESFSSVLATLDTLEGHPNFYKRHIITAYPLVDDTKGLRAYIYLGPNNGLASSDAYIRDGRWVSKMKRLADG